MYTIYRNNRKVLETMYNSYEEARKAIRRLQTVFLGYYLDGISEAGFKIKKVD